MPQPVQIFSLTEATMPSPTTFSLVSTIEAQEAAEKGIKIAVETIEQLRQIEGVAGVHIMTLQREETIPDICRAAGLYPRP